jgi:hypothetical protein
MMWEHILAGTLKANEENRVSSGIGIFHGGTGSGKLEFAGRYFAERRLEKKRKAHQQKRRFQRYNDGQKALCYSSHRSFISQVVDAGLGGMRLKTDSVLTEDSPISLVIHFKGEMAHFFVKILWQADLQGSYEYGVQFSKMDRYKNSPLLRYIAHLKLNALYRNFRNFALSLW